MYKHIYLYKNSFFINNSYYKKAADRRGTGRICRKPLSCRLPPLACRLYFYFLNKT